MNLEAKPENKEKVDILLEMMRVTAIGDVLTYQAMTGRLNEPVDSQHPALRKALRDAQQERMIFHNLSGKGYQRLDDREIVLGDASRRLRKIYRQSKIGITRISQADTQSLSMQDRVIGYAKLAAMQAIKTSTHGNSVNAKIRHEEQKRSLADEDRARLAEQMRSVTDELVYP
jgi:hypothetical protein